MTQQSHLKESVTEGGNGVSCHFQITSWRSVLLVEETGVLGENHRPDKLYHIMYRVHLARVGFELAMLVVIGTECIGRQAVEYYMSHNQQYLQINSTILLNKSTSHCAYNLYKILILHNL
jgi:hypothetical protein